MLIDIRQLNLKLKRDFVIAGGRTKRKKNLLVVCEGIGLGEASGSVAYGPEPEEIERDLHLMADGLKNVDIRDAGKALSNMSEKFVNPALCAVSTAWHDCCAKRDNQTLAERFSLDKTTAAKTSVTVSIGDISEIETWAGIGFKNIKVKLDSDYLTAIDLINQHPNVRFRIDANGSWNESDAEAVVKLLKADNVDLIEQPFPAGEIESWKRLQESSDIPVFMDESIVSADDVERVASYVNGVNIKIQKSGTLDIAVEALKRARLLGLKTMIGCMIESSVGIASALQLSSLADYCDLDGRLLLADDPFLGLDYNKGSVSVLGKMGHGVSEI